MPVASEVLTSGTDRYGTVNLHRLSDPRPFANLVYDVRLAANEHDARAMLSDTKLNLRRTVILEQPPTITLTGEAPETATAQVTTFKPETFTIEVSTPADAVLSVSNPYYPGWSVTVDDGSVPILRAYGALAAVEIPTGEHTIVFRFDPLSYKIGAVVSLLAFLGAGALIAFSVIRRKFNE